MAPSAPPVVLFDRVTKTYDNGFTAIKNVSFVVEDIPNKMEFVTILGPSGCGKSTVLRLIAGLTPQHPATSGTVLVQGKPVVAPGADRGRVFQDYSSFDNRTVEDNVAFGLECRGVAAGERRERAREWIKKVGLDVDREPDWSEQPFAAEADVRDPLTIGKRDQQQHVRPWAHDGCPVAHSRRQQRDVKPERLQRRRQQ